MTDTAASGEPALHVAYRHLLDAITQTDERTCTSWSARAVSCQTRVWLSGRRCCGDCDHDPDETEDR
jgi:hypothetical protein